MDGCFCSVLLFFFSSPFSVYVSGTNGLPLWETNLGLCKHHKIRDRLTGILYIYTLFRVRPNSTCTWVRFIFSNHTHKDLGIYKHICLFNSSNDHFIQITALQNLLFGVGSHHVETLAPVGIFFFLNRVHL